MSTLYLDEQTAPSTPSAGRVVLYPKTDGLFYSKDDAGVEGLLTLPVASQDEQESGGVISRAVTPGRQQFHPSAAKGWCEADAAGVATEAYNVTSVTDVAVGLLDVVWATDFSGDEYCAATAVKSNSARILHILDPLLPGSTSLNVRDLAGTNADPTHTMIIVFGDQA